MSCKLSFFLIGEINQVNDRGPSFLGGNAKVMKDFADEKGETEHSRIL